MFYYRLNSFNFLSQNLLKSSIKIPKKSKNDKNKSL